LLTKNGDGAGGGDSAIEFSYILKVHIFTYL